MYDSFGFSEEQRLLRDNVLALLERAHPIEAIRTQEAADQYPFEAYQALAEAGWLALPFSPAVGGADASHKDLAVFIEALGYHHAGITSAYMTTVIYGGLMIQNHAQAELRENLLPRLISGTVRTAIAYSEPASGSDAAAITTRAERRGDAYEISGQKVFTTNAHVADYLVVSTKTDPGAGHKGITLFLVPTTAPGVTIRNMDPIGRRTSLPNEVFFDVVSVPASHRLGEENDGWRRLMRGLNLERVLLAAAASGQCIKIIELAKAWAKERRTFGHPITDYQGISHKFADMAMLAQTTRLHTYHVAQMLDAGENAVLETAMAKTIATENNILVADMGVQILGGAGYMRGDMSRMWLDARQGSIGAGTSEIMRNVIARQVLQ
ncbi:MAG: alkylation response protein AidB-like acyl-CoA dehydrogenase [Gammaproteobacteria bacterium]|jgi:alkylation response protein AidB-like acyl-CoA dehydrogenase